jgi:hypothetical protein
MKDHVESIVVPPDVIEATINGSLVIFAGAGVSTESKAVLKTTLYQDIRAEIAAKPGEVLSFAEVMSRVFYPANGA